MPVFLQAGYTTPSKTARAAALTRILAAVALGAIAVLAQSPPLPTAVTTHHNDLARNDAPDAARAKRDDPVAFLRAAARGAL